MIFSLLLTCLVPFLERNVVICALASDGIVIVCSGYTNRTACGRRYSHVCCSDVCSMDCLAVLQVQGTQALVAVLWLYSGHRSTTVCR